MDRTTVAQARREETIGKQVLLQGWVRTRRDSKGGFSFIELNDGSCFGNVQIVADGALPNYESEVKKLHVGCSVSIEGEVLKSPAKGQATEVKATQAHRPRLVRSGDLSDPEEGDSLRIPPHHRPSADRAPTPSAPMARVRNCVCQFDPPVLPGAGLSLHPRPDHHRQRLRRGRRDVPRHHARSRQAAAARRQDRLHAGLLRQADLSDRQRPTARRNLRLRPGQGLHLRPDVSGRELQHLAASRRVLDDRAGDGVLRSVRQHDPGRGVHQADHHRCPDQVRRGHEILPGAHRQGRA